MTPAARAQWQIHACVLLWGFTAILGKAITLPAMALVVWRMALVAAALLLVPRVWRGLRAMPVRLLGIYAGIGALVALHWLTFYGSIKLANASVAVTCIALATVFLPVVEPWVTGRRFQPRELLLGIAVVPGVALVVGGVPAGMRLGIVVGTISAVLVAIFGALNKRYVERADALTVTFVELGAGGLLLALAAPLIPWFGSPWMLPGLHDGAMLLVLALACTLLPFALSLVALRNMSAFAAQLAINLEPVYAIVLAVLLLGEQRELGAMFYAGVVIILSGVFLHPLLTRGPRHKPDPATLGTSEAKALD
ncbi:DMT family transporter [Arenimonas sp. MALMAid1274]|uniref:DMT family transporter n=1 Tax=Arenimonas sp. MALMAid1274 TaxID=3411630 RepID=UPI003B9E3CDE